MGWPTPQDYNEAIQNPKTAFSDGELQLGQAVLTPLGLPRPISGGFASVYQMVCPQPGNWAVRCFLREFDDQQERYAAISDHLSAANLAYTVGFVFLERGIRVHGKWYPILKMEWVQGDPLHVYIQNNLYNPQVLMNLADQWVEMSSALKQNSIAHGDLQHGNIMVTNGILRLIDYDGMYVPSLQGKISHEIGHRNYQNPQRSEIDFGPYLDNFSVWVIYLSLLALVVDPQLWNRQRGGDECLIFRRDDFEQPEKSEVLMALEASENGRVQPVARLFKSLVPLDLRRIPTLDGQLAAILAPPPVPVVTRPTWLDDYAKLWQRGKPADEQPALSEPAPADSVADATWILDHIAAPGRAPWHAEFGNSVSTERAALGASMAMVVVLWLAVFMFPLAIPIPLMVTVAAIVTDGAFLYVRYLTDPCSVARRRLRSRARRLHWQLGAVERKSQKAHARSIAAKSGLAQKSQALDQERTIIQARERVEVEAHQKTLRESLAVLLQRRVRLRTSEGNELDRIQREFGAKLVELSQRIGALGQAESLERKTLLENRQAQFVQAFLTSHTIRHASVPNIGPGLKYRLKRHGVRSAADVEVNILLQVEGFGALRAAYLLAWRNEIEASARQAMPGQLAQEDEAALRSKYQRLRAWLEDEKRTLDRRQKREMDAIVGRYTAWRQDVEKRERAEKAKSDGSMVLIRRRYAADGRRIEKKASKLERKAEAEKRSLDAKIATWRSDAVRLRWEQERATRKLRTYQPLDFTSYMTRLVKL